MKLTVPSSDLRRALETVCRVLAPKATIPILSHVVVQPVSGELVLFATSLEVESRVSFPIENDKVAEAWVVPGVQMLKWVVSVDRKDGEVTLSKSGAALRLQSGGASLVLPSLSYDDLPPQQKVNGEAVVVELAGSTLVEMAASCLPAAGQPGHQFAIGGVMTKAVGGGLQMEATDGKYVAFAETEAVGVKGEGQALLSESFLTAISPLLTSESCQLTFNEKGAAAESNQNGWTFRFFGRNMEGNWPKIAPLFASNGPTGTHERSVVTVDKDELQKALTRAALVSDAAQGGKVAVEAVEGGLRVFCENQYGAVDETVEGESLLVEGGKATWCSSAYLLGSVRAAGGERVRVWHDGDQKLICVAGLTEGDEPPAVNRYHLIAPIRG